MDVENRTADKHLATPASEAETMAEKHGNGPENRTADKQLETPASEAETMAEKNGNGAESGIGGEIAEEDQINPEEYPKGIQFIFILLALILSIFMVALDLVSLAPLVEQTDSLIRRTDDRRNSHTKDHG